MSAAATVQANPVGGDTKESGAGDGENGSRRFEFQKLVNGCLGTYTTPEGAAVAHDVASYCFKGNTSLHKLNFPAILPSSARTNLSPKSVLKAASDAGMAMDAQLINSRAMVQSNLGFSQESEMLNISVDDYSLNVEEYFFTFEVCIPEHNVLINA
ncbi:hypothetical protein LXL04_007793 [Taraxacum kok-saghyz]